MLLIKVPGQFITIAPLLRLDCDSPVVIIFEKYFICLIRGTVEASV